MLAFNEFEFRVETELDIDPEGHVDADSSGDIQFCAHRDIAEKACLALEGKAGEEFLLVAGHILTLRDCRRLDLVPLAERVLPDR